MPIVPLTRFYNSLVMGAGVISIILAPIVFFASKIIIRKYRATIVARWKNSKPFKALKATSIYNMYSKYEQFYG